METALSNCSTIVRNVEMQKLIVKKKDRWDRFWKMNKGNIFFYWKTYSKGDVSNVNCTHFAICA